MEKMDTNKCSKCDELAHQKCGACQAVYYCSRECQKLHWPEHKIFCGSFKRGYSPKITSYSAAEYLQKMCNDPEFRDSQTTTEKLLREKQSW
jgi:hypothetical protein